MVADIDNLGTEGLVATLEKLREVAHAAFHLLDDSEFSEIRACCGEKNVEDLDAALQAFIDLCDPEGPGSIDAHAACFVVDEMAAQLATPSAAVAFALLRERRRQIAVEGWSEAHDDAHEAGDLARAAAAYALIGAVDRRSGPSAYLQEVLEWIWPWAPEWWKPKDPRRDLERAGALTIAEIERIDRAQGRS